VEELLNENGADVCRWWVSSLSYENDVRADDEIFQLAGESYRKVRNTLRFLLGNLGDFDASTTADHLADLDPASIDAWALAATADLQERVRSACLAYDFRRAHLALFDFCNDTLSAVYCVAVKDRLYCDSPDTPRRRRTQAVLHSIASTLCRLLAPFLPHTADESWRSLHGGQGCVHLECHQGLDVVADPHWESVMALRDSVLKSLEEAKGRGIENSLDAGVVLPDPEGRLVNFEPDLADLFEVSRVRIDTAADSITIEDLRNHPACERSWRRDETVAERDNGCMLSERDWAAVQGVT